MSESVLIKHRFRGPPESANGGYAAGLLAAYLPGPAEVRLHAPPPLERPLQVVEEDEARVLRDGEIAVASARTTNVAVEVPVRPSAEQVALVKPVRQSIYPSCFVCGPENEGGLHIFPGQVGDGVVAARWLPAAEFTNGASIREEIVWAALDCPGGIAWMDESSRFLLGTLSARLITKVPAGKPYVVVGWKMGREGRKLYSGTALLDEGGNVYAVARAVWVDMQPAQPAL
jgi:hypothetical protein